MRSSSLHINVVIYLQKRVTVTVLLVFQSKMTWGPYFWFHMWRAATSTISGLFIKIKIDVSLSYLWAYFRFSGIIVLALF